MNLTGILYIRNIRMSLEKKKTVASEKIGRELSAHPDDLSGNPEEVYAE
jgi:hypothetical protein